MAVVSIDVDALTALVTALRELVDKAPVYAGEVEEELSRGLLSFPGLTQWTRGGSMMWLAQTRLADCERRLEKAHQLLDSGAWTPVVHQDPHGYQYMSRTVTFDEAELATLDAAYAAEILADIREGRIRLDNGIPIELITVLQAGMDDPVFTAEFTRLVPPQHLAETLNLCDVEWSNRSQPGQDRVQMAKFQAHYATLVDVFAAVYSLTAQDQKAMNKPLTWRSGMTCSLPTTSATPSKHYSHSSWHEAPGPMCSSPQ